MSSSAVLRNDYLMFSYVYKGLDVPQYSPLLASTSALCKRDKERYNRSVGVYKSWYNIPSFDDELSVV
jgi:hypothetical protein